jgi:hypothetical protein
MTDNETKAFIAYPKNKLTAVEAINRAKRDGYIKALEEYESHPKVHGWVARDMDGELNFFGSELGDGAPRYNGDLGLWGNATDNKINISRESGPFGDLNYYDEPVEVELLIRRV